MNDRTQPLILVIWLGLLALIGPLAAWGEDPVANAVKEKSAPPSKSKDSSDVDFLKLIEVTIAQQKSATTTLQDLQTEKVDLETQLSKLDSRQLEDGPPYPILMLDRLNDAIANSKVQRESIEESLLAAREAVERARLAVENHKRRLRQLKETVTTDSDPKLKSTQRELRLAEETLVLRRQELSIEESNEAVRALTFKIDERKREIIRSQVTFAKQTIDEKNAELDAREIELNQKSERVQLDLQQAERRWLSARQEVDSSPNPTADQLERVNALKTAQQTIQIEQGVNNQRMQRLPMMRASWDRRYRVATGQSNRQQRRMWLEETISQSEQLSRERRSRELKLRESRTALAATAAKIDDAPTDDPELNRWLHMTAKSLTTQINLHNRAIWGIDSGKRALSRLRSEIEGEPSRSVGEWLADGWTSMRRLWNYELANIDDTSLTVGKVVSSLMFILFGYFVARWLSRLMGRRLPKLGVDEAAANAIESLSFYVLLTAFALAALRYANVPLTVFTFLGGAIAIGVGFGSQNILNNFISGLILLAERPIKAGDLILIDDTYGNVTQIGTRSTQIRTGENLDIIVPNSKFLENNVVNLTRLDDRLRTSIKIGVAYGSPLRRVIELLEQAARENPNVHHHPKPFVWFNDFGDNSLAFQVHFWVSARSVSQVKAIETQVRLSIDDLFRENNVVIAFPQRDLHLHSRRPIEFRMVGEEPSHTSLRAAG